MRYFMLFRLILSFFLTACLFPLPSFSMDEFGDKNFRIKKQPELNEIFRAYKEDNKPIGLAAACELEEMERKITTTFGSLAPLTENWIALDLFKTAHIHMDVTDLGH